MTDVKSTEQLQQFAEPLFRPSPFSIEDVRAVFIDAILMSR